MTEASPVMTFTALKDFVAGSCGLPVANTLMKITDLSNSEKALDVGEQGEIWIKGPQVYY